MPSDSKLYLLVEVTNKGENISQEMLDKLFLPLHQIQRLSRGAGLGLYCLSLRTHALHGSCGARIEESSGSSIFYFKIPIGSISDRQDLSTRRGSSCSTAASTTAYSSTERADNVKHSASNFQFKGGKPPEVLIVDDSLPTLKLLRRAVEQSGGIVDTAIDGSLALEIMKQKTYTVVVMDIQIPVMVGASEVIFVHTNR